MEKEWEGSLEWRCLALLFFRVKAPRQPGVNSVYSGNNFPRQQPLLGLGILYFFPLPLLQLCGFSALAPRRRRLEKILASHIRLSCSLKGGVFLHVIAVCACRAAWCSLLHCRGSTGAVKSSVNCSPSTSASATKSQLPFSCAAAQREIPDSVETDKKRVKHEA